MTLNVPLVINTSRSFPHSRLITGVGTRLTRRMPLVEQELFVLPKHLSSPPVFSGVRVTRSLVLYVCFVDRCLSFCTFSFGHCLSYLLCLCESKLNDFCRSFISKQKILSIKLLYRSFCWLVYINVDIKYGAHGEFLEYLSSGTLATTTSYLRRIEPINRWIKASWMLFHSSTSASCSSCSVSGGFWRWRTRLHENRQMA
jgi:hypothetical protein